MTEKWWGVDDLRFWPGFELQTTKEMREEWKVAKIIDDWATVYETPGGMFLVAEDEFGLIRLVRLEKVEDYLDYVNSNTSMLLPLLAETKG